MDLTAYLLHNTSKPSSEQLLEHIEAEMRDNTTSSIEDMETKLAEAYQIGIELAREQGSVLLDSALSKTFKAEKTAAFPIAAGLARGAASFLRGKAGTAISSLGKNITTNGITNAISKPAQVALPVSSGFKYASSILKAVGGLKALSGSPGTLGQKVVGNMVRNPGAALIGAGAVGGALTASRDPVTGKKQYIKGAVTGGALGGGAYALGAGNKLRKAIINPKGPQILGERAGAYARSASKAIKPNAPEAVKSIPYNGGPVTGTPKLANLKMQNLVEPSLRMAPKSPALPALSGTRALTKR